MTTTTKCNLILHGAAANSCPHSLKWVLCPRRELHDQTSNTANHRSIGAADNPSANTDTSTDSTADNSADEKTQVLIYPSSGVLNLATQTTFHSQTITRVSKTLITSTSPHHDKSQSKILARGEAAQDAAALRSITALDWVDSTTSCCCGIVASFSDGTVTSFRFCGVTWAEHVLIGNWDAAANTNVEDADVDKSVRCVHESVDSTCLTESIADISAVSLKDHVWLVGTASASGVMLILSSVGAYNSADGGKVHDVVHILQVSRHSAASVTIVSKNEHECLVFVGSASPRHNKVYVYTLPLDMTGISSEAAAKVAATEGTWEILPNLTVAEPHYHGCLLGHQDWITCFAWLDRFNHNNTADDRQEALLASSGHDAKIRLWKFTSLNANTAFGVHDDTIEESSDSDSDNSNEDEANIDDLEEGEARLVIRHSSKNPYNLISVSLEALLLGHEEAITSLSWRDTDKSQKPCLMSSSMDRSILLWMEQDYEQHNVTTGVWVPISRVGSAGGILGGSIGASLMGFVDAAFSPDGRIVGHGYGGSLHFWSRVIEENPAVGDEEENQEGSEDELLSVRWLADPCMTGHFRPVQDLAWEPSGEYLLTVGSDQTTRLWAEIPTDGSSCWVEVGRPQVHGYDMTSIACIGGSGSCSEDSEPSHRFVSGADEKVLRVFDAPVSTLRLLSSLKKSGNHTKEDISNAPTWRIERAFLPSLGLSNKATADPEQESAKYSGPKNEDSFVISLDAKEGDQIEMKLPSERDLGVTTLWPETRKLFGHDSELVCLDAYRRSSKSDSATLVASSCKARNDVASAAIRLWSVKEGKCVGVLKGGHRSTVSTLSFSADGKYLASSGKDRRICIWKRGIKDGLTTYDLSAAKDSAHKRIVWSVHFSPTYHNILASGSRDGLVKIWRIDESSDGSETTMEEIYSLEPSCKSGKTEPVTAVAFANKTLNDGKLVLGVGTESGHIEVWAIPNTSTDESLSPSLLQSISSNDSHFYTVNKLAWRPQKNTYNEDGIIQLTLSSCSEDCGVRIFDFVVNSA